MLADMADDKRTTRQLDLGPTGQTVAANIKAIRLAGQLTISQLSNFLGAAGWPINPASLSRIESCARRVDADDLLALATVLEVSPLTLLLPRPGSPDERPDFTGSAHESGQVPTARQLWQWATGRRHFVGGMNRATDPANREADDHLYSRGPDVARSQGYWRELHAQEGFRRASLPMWPIEESDSDR